ncbi:MAG: protein kinase [Elusimicrobiota bacterium]|jgi:tetratricopeptide (TPR) repeat protein
MKRRPRLLTLSALFGAALLSAPFASAKDPVPPPVTGQADTSAPSLFPQGPDPVKLLKDFRESSASTVQSFSKSAPAKAQEIDRRLEETEKGIASARTPEEKNTALREGVDALADLLQTPELRAAPAAPRNEMSNSVANVLNQVGGSQRAKALSDGVLADEPENRDALNNRAISQLQLGRYREAYEDASAVVRLEPKSERAFITRALANYNMRAYPLALEDARMALSINPNNQLAFQIARLSETRVTKSSALGLDDAQKAAADKVAREYEGMMSQRGALEAAPSASREEKAAATAPTSADRVADALNQQALTKVRMGDPRGAIQHASKALARDPKNAEAYYIRAAANNMVGSYLQSLEDATAALMQNPSHQQALDARTAAFLGLNRCGEALADAERAVAIDAKHANAWRNRGLAKECLGDLKGMAGDFKKAAELNAQFETAYREAIEKYNLAPPPARSAPRAPEPERPRSGGRRFLVVLACSLTGGFLIALGLLHILGGRAKPKVGAFEANYRVVRTIGQGGMGVVYEAVDKALGRHVAVKKMRDEIKIDARERLRFSEEARTVASLHHPNIVDIHTILESDGDLYLIFEFVNGKTLDEVLEKKTRLSLAEAQYVTRGVMSALAFAHQQGVVHRDLKPSNIMLTDDGWVKVMDFGIARRAKDTVSRSTGTNIAVGTPLYMAPEQERGEVRPESDLFSYGCMLYEMLTGRRPYGDSATTTAKMSRNYTPPSKLVTGISPEVDLLIADLLEPDPDRRLRVPGDVRTRLDAIRA